MLRQDGSKSHLLRIYDSEGKPKEACRTNYIILIVEINPLHTNGSLPMFIVHCYITYVPKRPAVRNNLLHCMCTR
jgi:hypothetical protein